MIFDAIRESHDLQRDLCRKLTASRDDIADRRVLFLQLTVALMAHAAAEERPLYVPLLMEDGGLDASRHALHEHHEVDKLLADWAVRNKEQAGGIATDREGKQLVFNQASVLQRGVVAAGAPLYPLIMEGLQNHLAGQDSR